jgi:hypothetical protein
MQLDLYQRPLPQRLVPYGYPGDYGAFADPYYQQRVDPYSVLRGAREPAPALYAQSQYQIPRKNQDPPQYRAFNDANSSADLPYVLNPTFSNPGQD